MNKRLMCLEAWLPQFYYFIRFCYLQGQWGAAKGKFCWWITAQKMCT